MKVLLATVASLFFSAATMAQPEVRSVMIGIDGLTCSACSFSTQRSIMKLPFVDSVAMELNTNIATVTLKKGKDVSVAELAQKVEEAGFSVRFITLVLQFSDFTAQEGACFTAAGQTYQFVGLTATQKLNGTSSVKVIGKKYSQKLEFKKWAAKIKSAKPCAEYDKKVAPTFVTL